MYNLYTLKNGLRIVTEKIDYINSISIGVLVNNGSRNENPSINGISHFIEHMLFKGTNKRTAKEIVEEIENVGGQINAYTSKESTCYYIKALNTHLELSIDILADMILNSKLDDEEISKEQGVVIEEINMNEDTPEEVLGDVYAKAAFGDDSLSYAILGTPKTVSSFNSKKLKDFINDNYTTKNTVISICGNFDESELKTLIENYFGVWEETSNRSFEYSKSKLEENFLYTEKNIEQLHINFGLKGVPNGDERGYSLVLLNNILGGGASSILFQKVREELGLCYSIYSYLLPFQNVGAFNVYTGLSPTYAGKAISVIKEELNKFKTREFTQEEININKEKIKAHYILGLESTSARMFNNGKSVLFQNKINTPEDIIKKIDRINKDTIKEVQSVCFNDGIVNGAFVGKSISLDELSAQCEKDVFAYNSINATLV
ncbi:M16 family metallopeptidase [Clostridium paridis]|uniref:Insulinase family protein n=1 Tax=Clostridium paridis TaxID=2803863 RepID=A0A937FF71_9CLOT|nr:pitrilysin family protein [Clostridium paridis]MBL4930888.1 insulinase family protein [Clostridium paridis]